MEEDELGLPDPDSDERRLNIQMPAELVGGTYANFANVSFSQYEFTLTFARIEHEVEEGDVPGAVVARAKLAVARRTGGAARYGRRDHRPRAAGAACARAPRDLRDSGARRRRRALPRQRALVAL